MVSGFPLTRQLEMFDGPPLPERFGSPGKTDSTPRLGATLN